MSFPFFCLFGRFAFKQDLSRTSIAFPQRRAKLPPSAPRPSAAHEAVSQPSPTANPSSVPLIQLSTGKRKRKPTGESQGRDGEGSEEALAAVQIKPHDSDKALDAGGIAVVAKVAINPGNTGAGGTTGGGGNTGSAGNTGGGAGNTGAGGKRASDFRRVRARRDVARPGRAPVH